MADKPIRHVLGLSGGRDSAALAVLLHKQIPEMEYFFCDTHKELPETYAYLARIEARLGISVRRLEAERGFDHWLQVYNGLLPSPRMRWCTKQLKIAPLEKFIGEDEAISYVGIRADENREGYVSTKPNIRAAFPFKERGLVKADILRLLEDSGIGLPDYYRWRSRSGCYFCFFQRKIEWVRLAEEHPDRFDQAVQYETDHSDGRQYTWVPGETLTQLLARRESVIAEHERAEARKALLTAPNTPLAEVLAKAFDDDEADRGCVVCHL